jgi:DNA-binding MarR family transcriptional regulator
VVDARRSGIRDVEQQLADPAQRAWVLMRQLVDQHSRHRDLAEALGFSLGAGRGKVLFQLRAGPLTHSQLADLNQTTAPYISLVVDRLEEHGLVERRPHPDDRRRKLVSLTPAGHSAINTAENILYRPPDAINTLGSQDLHRLIDLLQHIVDNDEVRT